MTRIEDSMGDYDMNNTMALEPNSPTFGGAEKDASPATSQQAALVALGRRAIAPPDLSVLMLDAAELAAKTLRADHYGVAELRPGKGDFVFRLGRAGAADRDHGVTEHRLAFDDDFSLSARALRAAHPLVVSGPADETQSGDALLKSRGISSAVVCPLIQGSQSFGTLGVYNSSTRQFGKDETLFVESMAHLVTATVARDRAEKALLQQNDFTTAVFGTMDTMLVVLSPDGRIERLNRACRETTGFSIEEVKGRLLQSAFLIPEEVGAVRESLDRLRSGTTVAKHESYVLTKHGRRRRVAWTYTAVKDDDGNINAIVGTGIDVTPQCEALERAEKAQAAANAIRQSLNLLKAKIETGTLSLKEPASGELPLGVKQNRRAHPRRVFPYVQLLAPMGGDALPGRSEFRQARCHDISACGFSFLAPDPPDYSRVVIAFGTPPSLMHLTAEVKHTTPITVDGETLYMVGCMYTGRARY